MNKRNERENEKKERKKERKKLSEISKNDSAVL